MLSAMISCYQRKASNANEIMFIILNLAIIRYYFQRQHPGSLSEFESLLRKRKTCEAPTPERKQPKISFASETTSQVKLDRLVLNFVVDSLQPFSVVEAESFVNLLQYVAPNCTPMTRRMLMTRLDASYVEMKLRLKESLASVPYVVVTADCWTTFRR